MINSDAVTHVVEPGYSHRLPTSGDGSVKDTDQDEDGFTLTDLLVIGDDCIVT